jgi:hypothetical protein
LIEKVVCAKTVNVGKEKERKKQRDDGTEFVSTSDSALEKGGERGGEGARESKNYEREFQVFDR